MPNTEKSQTTSRIVWIDYAKGIGIIFVVIGHVLRGLMDSPGDYNLEALNFADRWIYSFHMPLFFFLSGLFAPRTLGQSPSVFFCGKIRTILYPYVVWSAILGLLRVVSGQGSKTLTEFTLSFWEVIYQPTDIFWFLYALFLIAAAYYLLRQIKVPNVIILIGAIGLTLLSSFVADPFLWSPLNRVMIYSAYFVIAAVISHLLLGFNGCDRKLSCFITSIVSFTLITLSTTTGILNTPSPNLFMAFIGISGVLSLSFFCTQVPRSQLIQTLGIYSLQIYVAHTVVGALVRTGLFKVFKIENFGVHFILETLAGLYIPIGLAILSLKVFPYLFFIPKKKALA